VTASLRTPGSLTPPVEVLPCCDPSRDCARTISVVMIIEAASTVQTNVTNLRVFIWGPLLHPNAGKTDTPPQCVVPELKAGEINPWDNRRAVYVRSETERGLW
jgi:hypothetical protein